MRHLLLSFLLLLAVTQANAFELITEKVTDNIYALVGEIGPRNYENHALNNTMGFIVTAKGVVLVSSGASPSGAQLIEQSIAKVTKQPVKWVINIGAQDHHWLGNSYFAERGAKIIALKQTVVSQKEHLDAHMTRLINVIKDQAKDVKPIYANEVIDSDRKTLQFGDVKMELISTGGAHFPDDAMLWIAQQQVVFAGDLVFHDRLLGVQPYTPVDKWQKAFKVMASLKPQYVIPGHGHSGSLAKSQKDTGNYLTFLVTRVKAALDDWKEIGETVDSLSDAPKFKHLQFYDGWHRRNINRTYLYLESSQ